MRSLKTRTAVTKNGISDFFFISLIGIHTGSEKDTFRKRKTCLLCMNCFLGNLNLFHMWIKNRLQSRGLFKIDGSGYEKKRKFGNFGHTKHSRNIPTVSKEPQTDRTLIIRM